MQTSRTKVRGWRSSFLEPVPREPAQQVPVSCDTEPGPKLAFGRRVLGTEKAGRSRVLHPNDPRRRRSFAGQRVLSVPPPTGQQGPKHQGHTHKAQHGQSRPRQEANREADPLPHGEDAVRDVLGGVHTIGGTHTHQ